MSDLGSPGAAPPRPRRRTARLLVVGVVVVVLALLGTALVLQQHLVGHLGRIDGAFNGLSERPGRPAGQSGRAVNVLVLTVDHTARAVTPDAVGAPRWLPAARHVDSLLLLHLAADRRAASAVAVPLAAAIDVPGQGEASLGQAVSDPHASRLVATVEHLSGVRVDHVAAVDWGGLSELADGDGGIGLDLPASATDPDSGTTWPAGRSTVDGSRAIAFLGQRRGLSDPVLGPTLRAQYVMRELMDDTLHTAFRKHPFALYGVLDLLSRNLSVERGWSATSMRGLGFSLRNLRSAGIDYLVVPITPAGNSGSGVTLDAALGDGFWHALRDDRLATFVDQHPAVRVPPAVG